MCENEGDNKGRSFFVTTIGTIGDVPIPSHILLYEWEKLAGDSIYGREKSQMVTASIKRAAGLVIRQDERTAGTLRDVVVR